MTVCLQNLFVLCWHYVFVSFFLTYLEPVGELKHPSGASHHIRPSTGCLLKRLSLMRLKKLLADIQKEKDQDPLHPVWSHRPVFAIFAMKPWTSSGSPPFGGAYPQAKHLSLIVYTFLGGLWMTWETYWLMLFPFKKTGGIACPLRQLLRSELHIQATGRMN